MVDGAGGGQNDREDMNTSALPLRAGVSRRLMQRNPTPQRHRLLIEHRLDRGPRRFAVEAVALHEVLAVGEDQVGVLHQLQPLEGVFVVQPHAQADHFVQIQNLERKVALVGAELAVVGVVERDQRVDVGLPRRP